MAAAIYELITLVADGPGCVCDDEQGGQRECRRHRVPAAILAKMAKDRSPYVRKMAELAEGSR